MCATQPKFSQPNLKQNICHLKLGWEGNRMINLCLMDQAPTCLNHFTTRWFQLGGLRMNWSLTLEISQVRVSFLLSLLTEIGSYLFLSEQIKHERGFSSWSEHKINSLLIAINSISKRFWSCVQYPHPRFETGTFRLHIVYWRLENLDSTTRLDAARS